MGYFEGFASLGAVGADFGEVGACCGAEAVVEPGEGFVFGRGHDFGVGCVGVDVGREFFVGWVYCLVV